MGIYITLNMCVYVIREFDGLMSESDYIIFSLYLDPYVVWTIM